MFVVNRIGFVPKTVAEMKSALVKARVTYDALSLDMLEHIARRRKVYAEGSCADLVDALRLSEPHTSPTTAAASSSSYHSASSASSTATNNNKLQEKGTLFARLLMCLLTPSPALHTADADDEASAASASFDRSHAPLRSLPNTSASHSGHGEKRHRSPTPPYARITSAAVRELTAHTADPISFDSPVDTRKKPEHSSSPLLPSGYPKPYLSAAHSELVCFLVF